MNPRATLRHHVLVVEDDRRLATFLSHLLTDEGHQVVLAHDGREALELLARSPPDLVLLDLNMPDVGGFDVCQAIRQSSATRLLPVLMVTGASVLAVRKRAWEVGADDVLAKPFLPGDLRARCRSLLRNKRFVDELEPGQAILLALARAVEAKCPYTLGHTERVTALALALAERTGVTARERDLLRCGSMLHDVGKLSTPDAVLNKPGPLTAEEYEVVKDHPAQGTRIVEPLRSLREVAPLIRWHHERPDGQGYPDGLVGDDIPHLVRLLSVVDVYDALSSDRPYRPALSPWQSLELLRQQGLEGGLDPVLVDCFREIMRERLSAHYQPLGV